MVRWRQPPFTALYRSTCVSRHLQLRTRGYHQVGAKFYCLHTLADGNHCIWIKEKMLEFSSTVLSTLSLYLLPYKGKKVKFSHTRYRALGPELIPVYRQSARRWRDVNHATDLAVGCRCFLPGLRLPPWLSPDSATCKRQHTSDSSFTTHLSTQKGWKAELA